MRKLLPILMTAAIVVYVLVPAGVSLAVPEKVDAKPPPPVTEGRLDAMDAKGQPLGNCPLKHTDVKADISGFLARVTVTQQFENTFSDKIEAVYTFPLSNSAAVDDMTMKVGDRTIRGLIKPREEARQIYDAAKTAGHVASLLDQERPNIFTQSVANIEPGKGVTVIISYVELLKYEDGTYSFVFPMVVGPRYMPRGDAAGDSSKTGTPDAEKIAPPVTPKGARTGHDISISVSLDAGTDIKKVEARLHKVETRWMDDARTKAAITLANQKEIPNKDFVLEFSTVSDKITDAILSSTDKEHGYFTLLLQPPAKVQPKQVVPREIIFVIDTSGSQSGFPIEISKEIMRKAIKDLRPDDSFNLITFAGNTTIFWDKPKANTEENRNAALQFLENLKGGGGTEMMKAINAALGGDHEDGKVRIVAFFTDGYIGNDMEIVDAVRKNCKTTRVFSFGIGTSVNRYLLDNMAKAGRGEVEYALAKEEGQNAAKKFYERIDAPVLTDIGVDLGDLAKQIEFDEMYPKMVPDLFSVKPIILLGRYKLGEKDIAGEITIRGKAGEGKFERKVKLSLPGKASVGNPAIASTWARNKIDFLMDKDLLGTQKGTPDPKIKEEIVALGLGYRLMTQYTSFVAVEEKSVTIGGQPRTVAVPVEMPEGVSYEGVFGGAEGDGRGRQMGGGKGGAAFIGAARSGRPMAAAPPGVSEGKTKESLKRLEPLGATKDQARGDGNEASIPATQPATPLTPEEQRKVKIERTLVKDLQGLAAKLDKDGSLKGEKFTVTKGKVEVEIYLDKLDDKAIEALKKLGFEKLVDSPGLNMILGSIEVSKLEDLAALDIVRAVKLPSIK